jgi:hypothetical protein
MARYSEAGVGASRRRFFSLSIGRLPAIGRNPEPID